MSLTLCGPLIIRWVGAPYPQVSLQAGGPSPGSEIVLLSLSPATDRQLWAYGSDQRLYLYGGPGIIPTVCIGLSAPSPLPLPPNFGRAIQLVTVVDSDATQQWLWQSAPGQSTFINVGVSTAAATWALDVNGNQNLGVAAYIWTQNTNPGQAWALEAAAVALPTTYS
jgi:Ricin-type beta-trefoil lectin domain.